MTDPKWPNRKPRADDPQIVDADPRRDVAEQKIRAEVEWLNGVSRDGIGSEPSGNELLRITLTVDEARSLLREPSDFEGEYTVPCGCVKENGVTVYPCRKHFEPSEGREADAWVGRTGLAELRERGDTAIFDKPYPDSIMAPFAPVYFGTPSDSPTGEPLFTVGHVATVHTAKMRALTKAGAKAANALNNFDWPENIQEKMWAVRNELDDALRMTEYSGDDFTKRGASDNNTVLNDD